MTLSLIRVTGKYVSTDGRSTVDPTKLTVIPPVLLPGEQYRHPVAAKLKGDGEFLLGLYADSATNLTYSLSETLGGSARQLSVTVPAGASGELALKDLAGYSQPAGAKLTTQGEVSNVSLRAALPYLNAADYGFLTSATAATNNAAITSAISAAVAAGKPLYIPGYGSGTPYLVSAPIAHPGGIRIFGDPGKTYINNTLNTSALLTCTGSSGQVADLYLRHLTLDASTGNGIEVNNVDSWTFERVQAYACGWGFKQTGGYFFSNYLVGTNLKRFWYGALHITGGTGSQWNNTYINNQDAGAPQVCADSVVKLEELDDSVFNQLNIEWAIPTGQALLCNGARTVAFNSLHLEQIRMQFFDSQMVRGYFNTRMIIDAMTVKFCDVAPAGSQGGGRTLVGIGAGASIDIRGLTAENNTNTAAQVAKLAATDGDANGRLRVTAIKNDVFTAASTGAGLREIGDPIFIQKAGALTTAELPYSGMIGVDTTNGRLYWNSSGTVKYAAGV